MTKTEPKPAASPEDLLKAAVSGSAATAPAEDAGPSVIPARALPAWVATSMLARVPAWARPDARLLGFSGAALALGALSGFSLALLSGAGHAPGDRNLHAALDAGRAETARLGGDIAQIHQILADLRAGADAARKEAGARQATLGERLDRSDRVVAAKVAAIGDRLDQAEREQGARLAGLAAQIDRRTAALPAARPDVAKPDASKTDAARIDATKIDATKPEPAQTGSLAEPRGSEPKVQEARAPEKAPEVRQTDARPAEAKPKAAAPDKPPVIDAWALRDVYDGAAIIENRRRRLVEVAPGDVIPGIGRVEGVERRGQGWVVVTRQGLITPQAW